MPILTLVIPTLKNDGMKWTLVGRGVARQCQIQRGLLPVLAAPSPSGEAPRHRRHVCVACQHSGILTGARTSQSWKFNAYPACSPHRCIIWHRT